MIICQNLTRRKCKAGLYLCLLLLWTGPGWADNIVVDKIYHPYVQPLEQEIEWRTLYQHSQPFVADNTWLSQLAYGRSLNDRWFVEAYLVGKRSDAQSLQVGAYELEAKWQLTEQGEYWADWALLFEFEHETHIDKEKFTTALLLEKEWGRWSGTANVYLSNEWGADSTKAFETKLSMQARYRYSKVFEPALEFHSGRNTLGVGPAFLGQLPLNAGRRLNWEFGAIVGLDHKSPDHTFRLLLEYEF